MEIGIVMKVLSKSVAARGRHDFFWNLNLCLNLYQIEMKNAMATFNFQLGLIALTRSI